MRILVLLIAFVSAFHTAPALELQSLALTYDSDRPFPLAILNQQKLPAEEEWISVETPEQMVEIIRSLKVRGAPMIGISAALTLAQMAEQQLPIEEITRAAYLLKAARPTAVNLMACVDRILASMDSYDAIVTTAVQLFYEDIALCQAMGEEGASLVQPGEHILTICNTGGLATAGIGTALGVIKVAHGQGKNIHVYACETRPLLQGGRLTAWELEKSGIPYTLICDSMAASLMAKGLIDRVFVGADRIAANGDFANKIGTYSLAVLAYYHNIPFHVVAPYTTVDASCPNGAAIRIEERSADEVRGYGSLRWSPAQAPVYNPAFDVTPASLVTSAIVK